MGDWSAVVDRLNERRRQAAKSVLEDDIAWLEGSQPPALPAERGNEADDRDEGPREPELEHRLQSWLKRRAAYTFEAQSSSSDNDSDGEDENGLTSPMNQRLTSYSRSLYASPGTPSWSLPAKPPRTPLHACRSLAFSPSDTSPASRTTARQHDKAALCSPTDEPAHNAAAASGALASVAAAHATERQWKRMLWIMQSAHACPLCGSEGNRDEAERVKAAADIMSSAKQLCEGVTRWLDSLQWRQIAECSMFFALGFALASHVAALLLKTGGALGAASSLTSALMQPLRAVLGAEESLTAKEWREAYLEAARREHEARKRIADCLGEAPGRILTTV